MMDGDVSHSAVVIKPHELLESKWSADRVYEHGVLEVPTCYGDLYET